MLCPHAQLRAESSYVGAYITVASCQSSSKTCPECDLLLRLVEEYKPGWLNAGYVRALYLDYRHGRPVVIQLREDQGSDICEKSWAWFNGLEVVGSFRFYCKAKGRSPPRASGLGNALTGK